jgi:hypothetical protein
MCNVSTLQKFANLLAEEFGRPVNITLGSTAVDTDELKALKGPVQLDAPTWGSIDARFTAVTNNLSSLSARIDGIVSRLLPEAIKSAVDQLDTTPVSIPLEVSAEGQRTFALLLSGQLGGLTKAIEEIVVKETISAREEMVADITASVKSELRPVIEALIGNGRKDLMRDVGRTIAAALVSHDMERSNRERRQAREDVEKQPKTATHEPGNSHRNPRHNPDNQKPLTARPFEGTLKTIEAKSAPIPKPEPVKPAAKTQAQLDDEELQRMIEQEAKEKAAQAARPTQQPATA